ncbi:ABC transporter ATP-binding protein [Phormidium tenue]|uniref:Spermidine/putrescine import ATP-binding protein PotA n=1 Tax=Phormidium tenue NIES-30 TaxID=549789 RepID=A0A1U7JBQ7_9CYAN|nr:ABC transporter ATP-binding protein [Phormidium tenue]MBD2230463.1 ABC transporter ATP-binding protein [Phormidium tenue FACHB-1052]OKH51218.1 spermidine/putrescine ABC transporter ATP-binding protein [Phormidium tenue NIES-30]
MAQTVRSAAVTATSASLPDVELRRVVKAFGAEMAVCDLDLTVQPGEFFSILGPSGCGKTTTLRLIAGFETPTAGDVLIQGANVSTVPAHRRPVNTVFQSYALFDHMTVKDNIAFGLKIRRVASAQVRDRVAEALRLVRLESMATRYPAQLSGGQQQRVALARALVNHPAVMLLDEPLGALDQKLRKQMQVELTTLHRQLGITFIMVTHDQEEALSLSNRIAVMNNGQIEQIGTPSDIYDRPRTAFVADFIGDTNLLPGRIDQVYPRQVQVTTGSGLRVLACAADSSKAQTVVVSVRPEKINLSLSAPTAANNCYQGHISHLMYLGTHLHCVVRLGSGETLMVRQPNRAESLVGVDTAVYVHWAADDCLVLDAA